MMTYPVYFIGSLVFLCYRRVREMYAMMYPGDTIDGRHLDWFALVTTLTIMSTALIQYIL